MLLKSSCIRSMTCFPPNSAWSGLCDPRLQRQQNFSATDMLDSSLELVVYLLLFPSLGSETGILSIGEVHSSCSAAYIPSRKRNAKTSHF